MSVIVRTVLGTLAAVSLLNLFINGQGPERNQVEALPIALAFVTALANAFAYSYRTESERDDKKIDWARSLILMGFLFLVALFGLFGIFLAA